MIYIGIDPGQKGAMGFIANNVVSVIPFDPYDYVFALKGFKASDDECLCCIEAVHSISGQGIASSFKFGQTYGWLLGILDAIEIPYQPITPQKWKREFGLTSDKAKSVEVCKRLFHDVPLLRTERSRKEDDNMAEALLMALYAKRHF